MALSRRRFLSVAAAGAGAMLVAPRLVFANVETDRRFVFVIQRGAADGLNIVVPYAEPAYASLRGPLAIDTTAATRLDGTFALHPSLAQTAQMYRDGQALFVHAIASPYRDRSHFDGQNVLETGGRAPYQVKDGWLNRLAALLPATRDNAIAFAPTVPLALRGAVAGGRVIADWPGLRPGDLYEGRDLKPTASLDALIAGAAADSLRLDPRRTASALFAEGGAARPMSGLIHAAA